MVSAAGAIPIGRIAQGLPNAGSAAAPKTGIFSSLVGAAKVAGGFVSPKAEVATQVAGPLIQGAATGAGFAATQTATKGIGKILGFFGDIVIPSNVYDVFVLTAAILYVYDIINGFNQVIIPTEHLVFGAVSFALIAIVIGYRSIWTAIWVGTIFYYMFLVANGSLSASPSSLASVKIVPLVLALFFYLRMDIPSGLKGLPVVVVLDVFVMNMYRTTVLDFASNFNVIAGFVAHLFNRLVHPLFLYYAAGYMQQNSKAARKVFAIIFAIYFFWALATAGPAAVKAGLHGTGLEAGEIEGGKSFLAQSKEHFVNFITLKFLNPSVAYAYEKAAQLYGFGEAKEEPKMGLQLRDDPNMPKEFNLEFYDAPEPSIIMEVPNPLPVNDPTKRIIKVVDIRCEDKTGSAGDVKVVEPSPEPELGKPDTYTLVYYKGAKPVKCKFDGLKEGSNTAEIEVKYGFKADAELSTNFMRKVRLEAHVLGGKDPVVEDGVVPPFADYTNGPVAVTWGTVELVSTPVGIISGRTLSLELYVAKSGLWEGELAGINSVTLIIPSEFGFVETNDKTCSFGKVKEASNDDINVYKVKESLLKKANGDLRFIGDGIRFVCKMNINSAFIDALADDKELVDPSYHDPRPKWEGRTFKASIDYLFSTKKTVSFEVEGCKSGDVLDCKTEKKGCPGSKICNADRTWGLCNDKPGDECVES